MVLFFLLKDDNRTSISLRQACGRNILNSTRIKKHKINPFRRNGQNTIAMYPIFLFISVRSNCLPVLEASVGRFVALHWADEVGEGLGGGGEGEGSTFSVSSLFYRSQVHCRRVK